MLPAPYPDFSWFRRAVRVLPVIAAAALIGGAIGGFGVLAIDLTFTAPTNRNIGAEVSGADAAKATVAAPIAAAAPPPASAPTTTPSPSTPRPTRTFDAAPNSTIATVTAPPAPPTPPTPPAAAPASQAVAAQTSSSTQMERTPWPDALSRRHAAAAAAPAVAAQPASTIAGGKPFPGKKRVVARRSMEPLTIDNAGEVSSRDGGRPVYDYDGRDDPRAVPANPGIVWRRDRDQDQFAASPGVMPPQPPPPPPFFFGSFGAGG